MVKSIFRVVKAILFWEYDRGTWQYDVLAVVILILLFLSSPGFSRSWIHQPRSPDVVLEATSKGANTENSLPK